MSATKYALLRSGERWPDALLDGLELEPDGRLELQRVPAVSPPSLAPPGPAPPSGIAVDRSGGLYVADPAGSEITRLALDCEQRLVLTLPAPPAGICIGPRDWLFVCEPGAGQVQVFTTPDLARRATWTAGLAAPAQVAPDGDLGVYVLDGARVLRLDLAGQVDAAFSSALTLPAGCGAPAAIAAAPDGTLYVSCSGVPGVTPYDRSGHAAGPTLLPALQVQAMTMAGGVLYAADQGSGQVVLARLPGGEVLGSVAGFAGPVGGLAVDAGGRVYIAAGGSYVVAEPAAARRPAGTLTAGPLDAGEDGAWHRAAVSADAGPGTVVRLQTYAGDRPTDTPSYALAGSADTLVVARRYLWVRVTLEPAGGSSPVLWQVEAETPGDSYLEHLPALYARSDASGFLARLLDLARSLLGDLDLAIGDLPRLYDATSSPAQDLDWLAGWLAFDVPASLADGARPAALRRLIRRLPELYAHRGTPRGVQDLVEIYTGVRPQLSEDFRERAIWILDDRSALGFDTALPASAADGLVVDQGAVGAVTLAAAGEWGQDLFTGTAHRFTVTVPAARVPSPAARALLASVLDEQKPAHTRYHLCLVGPAMRVGTQARVGVDAIVAAGAPPLALDEGALLDGGARLGEPGDESLGVVGAARIGLGTRVG